ncbi:MAG: hypothetical protein ACRDH6_06765 [Actinomycetota bacterium]
MRLFKKKPQPHEDGLSDEYVLRNLRELCDAYVQDDRKRIEDLEQMATAIGKDLNRRGGIEEMRRIFYMLGSIPGARTLEMHWGGIGEWMG